MANRTAPTKEPIHSFRVEKGKTLEQMSEMLGVTARTLIRWEHGKPRMPVKYLGVSSSVYDKPVSEIRPDLAKQFSEAAQ